MKHKTQHLWGKTPEMLLNHLDALTNEHKPVSIRFPSTCTTSDSEDRSYSIMVEYSYAEYDMIYAHGAVLVETLLLEPRPGAWLELMMAVQEHFSTNSFIKDLIVKRLPNSSVKDQIISHAVAQELSA